MNIRTSVENDKCTPVRKHRWDAGLDLVSNNKTFTINPSEKVKVHTGVRMAIPPRHMGLVVPRSGLGSKFRIGLANTVGVIDSDYRGEIIVNLVNDGNEPLEIKQYERFCQIVIVPVAIAGIRVVDSLDDTTRGDDGFGSTGELSDLAKAASDSEFKASLELEEILEWVENDNSN